MDQAYTETSFARTLHLLMSRLINSDVNANSQDDHASSSSTCHDYQVYKTDELHKQTERLENNELYLTTRKESGYTDPENKTNISVPSMIYRRQVSSTFTTGEKCRISNAFLPNSMTKVAEYNSKAFCGIYSSDGKMLVTTTQDNNIHLYSTGSGEFQKFKTIFVPNVSWSILDLAFSPDGNYIAYSCWSNAVHLCPIYGDSSFQVPLQLVPFHSGRFCVFSIAFSNNGNEIVGAANDGCLYVYDLECHKLTTKIKGHTGDVNAVVIADNSSQILYSAGDDGLCMVWDRRTLKESRPKPVGVLAGHMGGITYIDPRGDGRYLLTNSKDQSIKLWDVRKFSSKKAQMNTRVAVVNQDWDYRWHTHVPKQRFKSTEILEGDTSVMTYRGHVVIQTLIRCHFSPVASTGQRYIYTGCGDGRIVIYDLLTGKIVKTLEGHDGCVRDVHWHPYDQEIISTSWDGIVGCWRYYPEPYSSDARKFTLNYEDDEN
ncbi:DDB1- and CUL4-associated factor 11 isoform X2 [Chelonus insularis]|uniref:DDB1- and CUL4-associated factor 11 isoform X2 n=1 Tax=Chelonus insularis TaxID=460826 RepID=UPI00158D5B45|nr:DDB1- and CUL4-associated factor 11 isoform X2 [Chelonus insularis]